MLFSSPLNIKNILSAFEGSNSKLNEKKVIQLTWGSIASKERCFNPKVSDVSTHIGLVERGVEHEISQISAVNDQVPTFFSTFDRLAWEVEVCVKSTYSVAKGSNIF